MRFVACAGLGCRCVRWRSGAGRCCVAGDAGERGQGASLEQTFGLGLGWDDVGTNLGEREKGPPLAP